MSQVVRTDGMDMHENRCHLCRSEYLDDTRIHGM